MKSEEIANLLEQYGSKLILYARQWSSSPEDIVHDAFLQLIQLQFPPAVPPDNPIAWLFRVVRNRALDQCKLQQRRREREQIHALERQNEPSPSSQFLEDYSFSSDPWQGIPEEQKGIGNWFLPDGININNGVHHTPLANLDHESRSKIINGPIKESKVEEALKQLNPMDREIIIASIWGNRSFAEIGELLGCGTSTAHRRFHAALSQLKTILSE